MSDGRARRRESTALALIALLVIPLLAGIGLATVIVWLPGPWDRLALAALVLAVLGWSVRELIWARRMSRWARDVQRQLGGERSHHGNGTS